MVIHAWVLFHLFDHQDDCLFEMGVYSRLGTYLKKYKWYLNV